MLSALYSSGSCWNSDCLEQCYVRYVHEFKTHEANPAPVSNQTRYQPCSVAVRSRGVSAGLVSAWWPLARPEEVNTSDGETSGKASRACAAYSLSNSLRSISATTEGIG